MLIMLFEVDKIKEIVCRFIGDCGIVRYLYDSEEKPFVILSLIDVRNNMSDDDITMFFKILHDKQIRMMWMTYNTETKNTNILGRTCFKCVC